MGVASYRRGSRAISAQFCRDRGCIGCVNCRDVVRTPRPAGWGSKTRARAEKKAAGLLRYWMSRDRSMPSAEDLADMVQVDDRIGRSTAISAAVSALDALNAVPDPVDVAAPESFLPGSALHGVSMTAAPAKRPRGRPPVADKRLPRVKMNGAEWSEVQRKAEAAGMTAAAWVRMRCGV